jgi:heme-degrading monooxygenase HmoA
VSRTDALGGGRTRAGDVAPAARVLFLVRVPRDREADFLAAYELVRYAVADGVPGHLRDQVCQSDTDPELWLITSEWDRLQSFVEWERSPEHRELVRPLRACMTEARSIRFHIRAETQRSTDADHSSPLGGTT